MLLNFWKKLLTVYQNHHTSETQRLDGKESRGYSFCSYSFCKTIFLQNIVSALQRQSSYFLFWPLHNVFKVVFKVVQCFCIIKYYQCLYLMNLTKLATSEWWKRSCFTPKSSNAPEPRKKMKPSYSLSK